MAKRNSCRCLAVFLVLAVSIFSQVVVAQTSNPGMGRLAEHLPSSGQDDSWRVTNTGDSIEIENLGNPNAIRYYYVGPVQGSEGRRTIETDIGVHPNGSGSAGLLYGLRNQGDLYHMVTLNPDGVVSVFRRDNSGFRPLLEQSSQAFQPGKMNRLKIEEKGDEISFFLNDSKLGLVGGDLFGSGAVGIGVVGDVRAFFNFFSDGSPGDRSETLSPNPQSNPVQGMQLASRTGSDLEMRPVQIRDTQGPAGAMIAYQTLVPANWQTQGGIQWSQQDSPQKCFTGAKLIWGAGLKDETYGLAFLHPMSWGMSNQGPARFMCLPQDLTDAEMASRSYFQAVSHALQVQIKSVERPKDLAPFLDPVRQSWQASWAGNPAQAWVDGVVITADVATETSKNDGYFLIITKHVEMHYGQTVFRVGRTEMILGLFTPPGKLEKGHSAFGAILNNLRVNPQWQQVEAKWWSQKVRAGNEALRASSQANSSIGDMLYDSWKRRQNMQDAAHSNAVNGIWEVQPWESASGDTVLLNQNYDHAWELGNGNIVLTNDANFNPMQSTGQTGTLMQQR